MITFPPLFSDQNLPTFKGADPMPNRLSQEKSPYLLQHANNPVDWFPWGEEAFQKAAAEDKPIFLSIGYATCHWCHVMERESFEDEEVAGLLNRYFVSIKVDREERPDVDHIYMTVCQALKGSGGWPLSIFMTPDRKPFFAGSYFPKSGRLGMPGLTDIILQLAHLWKDQRNKVVEASGQITRAIQPKKPEPAREGSFDAPVLERSYEQLRSMFDERWGGFGKAPKFPTPHQLTMLLRWHRRNPGSEALAMVEKTLEAMRHGGIFDQVGFGFHRYSVDERWLVPHFEKMLYDQAMLAMAYTEAFQVTGKAFYGKVSEEIFDYLLRDMTDSQGAFYSAEDADSEGVEGLFYVWTPEEVKAILGEELGNIYCRFYDISPEGNFEDRRSIAHISRPLRGASWQGGMDAADLQKLLVEADRKLFAVRERRIHPLKDDKILTSWNGLMIAALAKGYQALRNPLYVRAAERAADFILGTLRQDSGKLLRRYRSGEAAHPGYADDYAFLIWGLIDLYEATFNLRFLEEALHLQQLMLDLFWDEQDGGFFYTAYDGEQLIVRDKEIYDGAVPSSNSVAALNLLRLARMTGNTAWEEKVERLFKAFFHLVSDFPSAYTQFLHAVDFALGPSQEIVLAGDLGQEETRNMVEAVHAAFLPNRVLMYRGIGEAARKLAGVAPFMSDLQPSDGQPTIFICQNYACRSPITALAELKQVLASC
jgi:uncharacterized protein YyaL (SSP411 family)